MATPRQQFFQVQVDQPEASFAVENAGHPGSWQHSVPVIGGSLSHNFIEVSLPDESVRIDRGSHVPIRGPKSTTVYSFQHYASGLGTAAGDGVAAVGTPFGAYLESGFGTEILDTGVLTSGTPTDISITIASATITTNTIAGFDLGASTGIVWRPVTVSGSVLTPWYALPSAPATGAIVYGAASYQWLDQVLLAESMQAEITTEHADTVYLALGCYPTRFELGNAVPGGLPMWTVNNVVTDYSQESGGGSPAHVAPASKEAYMAQFVEIVPNAAFPIAYSAANRRKLRNLTVTLDRALVGEPDPNASQAVCGWEDAGAQVTNIQFTISVDDAWRAAWTNGTEYTCIFHLGRTPAFASVLAFRQVHLTEHPTDGDEGGVMTINGTFGDTAGITEPRFIYAQG